MVLKRFTVWFRALPWYYKMGVCLFVPLILVFIFLQKTKSSNIDTEITKKYNIDQAEVKQEEKQVREAIEQTNNTIDITAKKIKQIDAATQTRFEEIISKTSIEDLDKMRKKYDL
jgi:hypothetical protein